MGRQVGFFALEEDYAELLRYAQEGGLSAATYLIPVGERARLVPPTEFRLPGDQRLFHLVPCGVGPDALRYRAVADGWRQRIDESLDIGCGAETRRIEAVSPDLGIGRQASNRLVNIGTSDKETLGPAGEEHASAGPVDRLSGRTHPFNGKAKVEEWARRIACGVLNRKTRNPRRRGRSNVGRNSGWFDRETTLEVSIERHIDTLAHRAQVRQFLVEEYAMVPSPE